VNNLSPKFKTFLVPEDEKELKRMEKIQRTIRVTE